MKAEIKFAITKNGPKAFMSTYNDDWTPANDTRLRVYKKDKRSVTPANAYPEGKGYALPSTRGCCRIFSKSTALMPCSL